ncbi:glycosyl hydrolase family 65 protein [Lentzea sp. HUAS12]|uniref:glycosyl hydrolase family 65 protein n=1 Tax=Lentzea sp. HUAS12 TaxID=2951806 RepID=UPI00209F927B|nr:glycosyl hydrolase family 65 protein [Lentzea sp. HUAS12]USX54380.1 glycoside hydrolase family 65 protein [Lentzea sp. HUAS12]
MTNPRRTADSLALVRPGASLEPCIARRVDALRALGVRVRSIGDDEREDAASAGDLVLDGSSDQLRQVLDEQLRRRARGRVPEVGLDPGWTLREAGGDPLRHRVIESLFTLGSGGFATRGSVEEERQDSVPMVLAAGVYTGHGPDEHLMQGPLWTALDLSPAPSADEHVLDLLTATLLRRETEGQIPFRSLRFASAARPGLVALRAEGAQGRLDGGEPLRRPADEDMATGTHGPYRWAQVQGVSGMTALAWQRQGCDRGVRTVERLAVLGSGPSAPPPSGLAAGLEAAERLGFDFLLLEHRKVWERRWDSVNVEVPDAPEVEREIRFALFQLWCNAGSQVDAAVGARGLSGRGYSGHVFWDADVFVLPALATMDPRLATAMVDYRFHRLPAARATARAAGHAGARFPWESASGGLDVTPTSGYLGAAPVAIRTGALEEHITADVAWAAWHCARWSGRRSLLVARRALFEETARYWASRCRVDGDGRAHVDDVIGPDEYHEQVSDNAFTNVMARWNLRAAAGLAASRDEAARWRRLADAIVDGHDPRSGLYEQFTGYFDLRPLEAAEIARTPVAADVLLGKDRIAATQLIKQPDVLMLHHLVPDEVAPDSLVPNLDYYGPRTTHGSSLSPAISAALLARARRPDEALRLLRIALRVDLDDLTGTTAAGLHVAAMGGAWQAVLFGFAGVRVHGDVMHVDPVLPTSWRSLGVRFHCLGRLVRLRIGEEEVRVEVNAPLRVKVCGGGEVLVTGSARIDRSSDG